MVKQVPRVSMGLPVYNGERFLVRAIESLLAQTFTDFELVISDNASDDGTAEICQRYANRDPRIRYYRNTNNTGQIANCNLVVELATGKYFKWAGYDDWWEPDYLEEAVAALDGNPEVVLVTCYQKHYEDGGRYHYVEYTGERPDSPNAGVRFRQMLRLFCKSRYVFDPLYGLIRMSALRRTALLRPMLSGDQALAIELSLLGPFFHIPRCLTHRRVTPDMPLGQKLRWIAPSGDLPDHSLVGWCREIVRILRKAPMPRWEKVRCYAALRFFFWRGCLRRLYVQCRRRLAVRTRLRGLRAKVWQSARNRSF